jgi:hypothetical protein
MERPLVTAMERTRMERPLVTAMERTRMERPRHSNGEDKNGEASSQQ